MALSLSASSCSAVAVAGSGSSSPSSILRSSVSHQNLVSAAPYRGEWTCDSLRTCSLSTSARGAMQMPCLARASGGVEVPPLALPKQKIQIKLQSFWVPPIEEATKMIIEAARSTGTKIMGPIPIPTKRRVYSVPRSLRANRGAREHFEIRSHHRFIELENPNADTVDSLMQLDIPSGVEIEVKHL